jgi:hypothetical protein
LVPELLYHMKRGTAVSLTNQVTTGVLEAWGDVKERLIGDRTSEDNKQVCIRLLVQYPNNESLEANRGKFHGGKSLSRCKAGGKCDLHHDFLATVSGQNRSSLVGKDAITILNRLLKGPPTNKRKQLDS